MLVNCVLLFLLVSGVFCKSCLDFDITIAQKIEHEGFHRYDNLCYCLKISHFNKNFACRDVNWLVEIISPSIADVNEHNCSFLLKLDVNRGMFVNPDQIADLMRLNQVRTFSFALKRYLRLDFQILAYIDGEVNVETITHESDGHTIYIFLDSSSDKISVNLPVHLRYQRAQITGG